MSEVRRGRRGRWWILGSCGMAALFTVGLLGWPSYRKARLMANIEQLHGLTTGFGSMAPDWLRPGLEWLGEPRSSYLEELFFDELRTVNLIGTPRAEQPELYRRILQELPRLTQLQVLDLRHAAITDEDIRPLSRLQDLRKLNLLDNRLTQEGVRSVAKLRELRNLDLSESNLDDAAIAPLSELENLKTLDLSGTKVTDAAIPTLQKLRNLQHLDLSRTSVSEAGCRQLTEALPRLDITDD